MRLTIDIDLALVARAAEALGTRTTDETIAVALRTAIDAANQRLDRRRRLLNTLGSPDLDNEHIMSGA